MIHKKEMGYYGRIKSQHSWRKSKEHREGQLLQRGHGKIPLEPVRFNISLSLDDEIRKLRHQLGYT